MSFFDEVKKRKCKLCKLYGYMANWCSGCEAGSGGIMRKDWTKEFKLPKICCHSNHRYLHQRLLLIVSQFSE